MSYKTDAHEFGLHVRQGGWRLGLLVARNVEPGTGSGDRTDLEPRHDRAKVSATQFAEASGTSKTRVMRYVTAWEKAAKAGLVPHAAELKHGQNLDLDAAKLPEWSQFYSAVSGGRPRDSRAEDAVVIIRRRGADAVIEQMNESDRAEVVRALAEKHPNILGRSPQTSQGSAAKGELRKQMSASDTIDALSQARDLIRQFTDNAANHEYDSVDRAHMLAVAEEILVMIESLRMNVALDAVEREEANR